MANKNEAQKHNSTKSKVLTEPQQLLCDYIVQRILSPFVNHGFYQTVRPYEASKFVINKVKEYGPFLAAIDTRPKPAFSDLISDSYAYFFPYTQQYLLEVIIEEMKKMEMPVALTELLESAV